MLGTVRTQAMSAFMFFSNANRDKVKADNPGIAFGEVGRKLGELWRAATAEDKKEYEEQAAADKVTRPAVLVPWLDPHWGATSEETTVLVLDHGVWMCWWPITWTAGSGQAVAPHMLMDV